METGEAEVAVANIYILLKGRIMARYLDEEDEMLEQQTQQQAKPADEKKKNWDNIDYTRYSIPEGEDVKNAKVTRIAPEEGEKYPKWVIEAYINGKHYSQELWREDRQAFFEKDANGKRANRVNVDQLVAKYFSGHFTFAASVNDDTCEEDQEPGILVRLWAWLKGFAGAAHQEQPQGEDQPQEPVEHEQYTDLADVDGRIAAVRTMADLQRTIGAYENVVNVNKGIILNARKMYDEKSEYIARVANISESADHRPLQSINANVDKALVNVAKNLYDMPLVRKYVEQQQPTPSAPMPEQKEQTQEDIQQKKPQEQAEELQAVLDRMQRESVITKVAAVIMAVITLAAVWQCSSARNHWMSNGREEGRKEVVTVANARIDSLNAVILQQRQVIEASSRNKTAYKGHRDARAEVNAFFSSLDEMKALRAEIAKLKKQNGSMSGELRILNADYESLRQTANRYAKEYNNISRQQSSVKAKKVQPLPEIPEREPKAVFNTIQGEEKRKPYKIQ